MKKHMEIIKENKMKIELADCTNAILREIDNPRLYRKDIAMTYALALRSSEEVDWAKVNKAIMNRWSSSGLKFIKEQAWSGKCYKEK